ncbi:TPA: hypothetical protein ACGUIF_000974 [Serratia liquefaciens]
MALGPNMFRTYDLIPELKSRGISDFWILDTPPLTGKYSESWNKPVILDINGMVLCHFVRPWKGDGFWTFHKAAIGPESPERRENAVKVDIGYFVSKALFGCGD